MDEARLTGRRYRRCNWVRFLNSDDNHNIRCFREVTTGNIVFEASEDIEAGAELVARYAMIMSFLIFFIDLKYNNAG